MPWQFYLPLLLFLPVVRISLMKKYPHLLVIIPSAMLNLLKRFHCQQTSGPIPVPVGTDITIQIQAALLSSLDCASAGYAYVELRKDFSIYMSCAGENEFNAGTWEEIDDSTLALEYE